MIKVNPFDVLNCREVSNPPYHYEYTTLNIPYHKSNSIKTWITFSLKSKFYFGETLVLDPNNKYVVKYKVGFEDPKELTIFLLTCPYLT